MHTSSWTRLSFLILSLAAASGCDGGSGDPDGGTCPIGAEGCACTSGGACDGFLVCIAGACVDPTADFDAGEPRDAGPSDAGSGDAGAGDAGPPCALATSSLPPPESIPRPVPATDHGYWLRGPSGTLEIAYHGCRGVETTLALSSHPIHGESTGFSAQPIDARTVGITRRFEGVDLFEVYDTGGALQSEHTAAPPVGLSTLVDSAGVIFYEGDTDGDGGTDTLHSVDLTGTARSVALDPSLSSVNLVRMHSPGVFVSARDASSQHVVLAWDGVSGSVGPTRVLTADSCSAEAFAGPALAAWDADNFYFSCNVSVDGFGTASEVVQVIDGVDACVVSQGAGTPYVGLLGTSRVDSAGNLWGAVNESASGGTSDVMTGVARVERGTCGYASHVVPNELENLGGPCGVRVLLTRVLGVTETMAWTYRQRVIACSDNEFDGPFERVRLGPSGELELVP